MSVTIVADNAKTSMKRPRVRPSASSLNLNADALRFSSSSNHSTTRWGYTPEHTISPSLGSPSANNLDVFGIDILEQDAFEMTVAKPSKSAASSIPTVPQRQLSVDIFQGRDDDSSVNRAGSIITLPVSPHSVITGKNNPDDGELTPLRRLSKTMGVHKDISQAPVQPVRRQSPSPAHPSFGWANLSQGPRRQLSTLSVPLVEDEDVLETVTNTAPETKGEEFELNFVSPVASSSSANKDHKKQQELEDTLANLTPPFFSRTLSGSSTSSNSSNGTPRYAGRRKLSSKRKAMLAALASSSSSDDCRR